MSTFKHLLVPIDGSSGADQAIAKALVLAADQAASVHFVHVIDRASVVMMEPLSSFDSEVTAAVNAAGELLLGQAVAQAREHDVPCTQALRITDGKLPTIADQILEEARAHAVDLIVCGSHGKTGFRAMILGSVADGLIHRSHSIPLLLIPTQPPRR